MSKYKVKTIDIAAREWFDKINGNSYFSARVTVNYGMPDAEQIVLPFQYGYGNAYEYQALKELAKRGFVNPDSDMTAPWSYCADHRIIYRRDKKDGCLKKDVVEFGSIPSTTDRVENFKVSV